MRGSDPYTFSITDPVLLRVIPVCTITAGIKQGTPARLTRCIGIPITGQDFGHLLPVINIDRDFHRVKVAIDFRVQVKIAIHIVYPFQVSFGLPYIYYYSRL